MIDTSRIAFVWTGDPALTHIAAEPPTEPKVGVTLWPALLPCDLMAWYAEPDADLAERIRAHDVFLVNVFHSTRNIGHIRRVHPRAFIIALPDPPIDAVLVSHYYDMLRQMAMADVIAGRNPTDGALYGGMLAKPGGWLPDPIGPAEAFRRYWNLPKEDYLISVDHSIFRVSLQNVAALAAVQRETGLPVRYWATYEHTHEYARIAGLEVTFHDEVTDYGQFCEHVARARLGVDMYPVHGLGRHGMTHAMVGTPAVVSAWCNPCGMVGADPLRPDQAVEWACELLANAQMYAEVRQKGFEACEALYGFDASRARMVAFLENVLP